MKSKTTKAAKPAKKSKSTARLSDIQPKKDPKGKAGSHRLYQDVFIPANRT